MPGRSESGLTLEQSNGPRSDERGYVAVLVRVWARIESTLSFAGFAFHQPLFGAANF